MGATSVEASVPRASSIGAVQEVIASAMGSEGVDLRRLRSCLPEPESPPLVPVAPALSWRLPRLSGDEHGLANPVDVEACMSLNLSKSRRREAAPKTAMGLARLAGGTDEDEGIREGMTVGR
jgi:hypothetical protein